MDSKKQKKKENYYLFTNIIPIRIIYTQLHKYHYYIYIPLKQKIKHLLSHASFSQVNPASAAATSSNNQERDCQRQQPRKRWSISQF